MIDAISIRKQLQYDPVKKTMVGYVDLGNGPDEDAQEASETLVFLVNGKSM